MGENAQIGNYWIRETGSGRQRDVIGAFDERERYGYEIVQELNSPGEVIIAEGSIYPLLKRLSQQGWITAEYTRESPLEALDLATGAGEIVLVGSATRDLPDDLLKGFERRTGPAT